MDKQRKERCFIAAFLLLLRLRGDVMIDGQPIINFSVYISGMVLCFLGTLMLAVFGKSIERKTRMTFLVFFVVLALDMVLNILGDAQNGNPDETSRGVHYAAELLHRVFSPFLAYIIASYLSLLVFSGRKKKTAALALAVMLAAYLGFLFVGQAQGQIFTIDENGFFRRGTLYFPLVVLSCMPLVYSIVLLLRFGKRLTRRELVAFWIYCALPMAAVLAQVLVKGMYFIIPATIIAALTMFLFIIADRTETYYEQERQQTEMRMAIMLSQIQPHFLYNALNAIYYLSGKNDTALTQKAVSEFADYLRVNLNSLRQKEPVPFETEQHHTEVYLWLEKMSMEQDLEYSFDCETTEFFIPVLTLQPLVENAVRHGLSEKQGGGFVKITTRDGGDHVTVTVEDNGAGFDPEKIEGQGEQHVGLDNVRRRLAMQCGGKLHIQSERGQGTTAVITIPKGTMLS